MKARLAPWGKGSPSAKETPLPSPSLSPHKTTNSTTARSAALTSKPSRRALVWLATKALATPISFS